MVAGKVEEGHVESLDEGVEFLPLFTKHSFVGLFCPSLDEVAHTDHELGSQFVESLDCLGEDAGPDSTRPVRYQGELEIVRVVEERLVGPRFLLRGHGMLEVYTVVFVVMGPCPESQKSAGQ